MNTESIAKRFTGTGLFAHAAFAAPRGEPGSEPIEAYVNATGHDLLAKLGAADFRLEVARRAPGCALGSPGWTFGRVAGDIWPAEAMHDPRATPPVLSHLESGSVHRLLLDIRCDLSWFDGHFPGQPILAGVAQLHLAVLLARRLYRLEGFPQQITRLKFQHLIMPPHIVELKLECDSPNNVRFRYLAKGLDHSQGRLHFSGA